jgi:hypothetical protein
VRFCEPAKNVHAANAQVRRNEIGQKALVYGGHRLNVMSKFLNFGVSVEDVVLRSTWNPVKEIKHEDLGHISVGDSADISVIRIEKGKFGFVDSLGGRLEGRQKLVCELTVRNGLVVSQNGMAPFPANGRRYSKCWRPRTAPPIHDCCFHTPGSDRRGQREIAEIDWPPEEQLNSCIKTRSSYLARRSAQGVDA